jgi:hypothetical protein
MLSKTVRVQFTGAAVDMIQLQRAGIKVDPRRVAQLRDEFQTNHFVFLPKLVEPSLLDFILARFEQGQWQEKVHKGIGSEVTLADSLLLNMLHMLMNFPVFLETIREITNCHDITWFRGRIYRFIPGRGHHDSWHSDDMDQRKVALSLNLSVRGYEGGIFELRDRKSKQILVEAANTGWGDALLFRISKGLDHRITEATGSEPKTAFAGWFKTERADLLSRLHNGAKL